MDILLTILDVFQKNRKFALTEIVEDEISAIEKLKQIYFHNFQNFAVNPTLTAVIFSEEIFKNDPRLSEKVLSIMKNNQEDIRDILENGQRNKEIRSDIPVKQLSMIILGSLRLFITQWRLNNFSFDLEDEGNDLWDSIKKIVSPA